MLIGAITNPLGFLVIAVYPPVMAIKPLIRSGFGIAVAASLVIITAGFGWATLVIIRAV